MAKNNDFYSTVENICQADARYKTDGYEFLMQALHFTQQHFKRQGHVSGQELLEGVRLYAIEQFGPMAKTVLAHWGIHATVDIGNMVFNMTENKLLSKTDNDSIDDFKTGYDFQDAFGNVLKDALIQDLG